MGQQYARLGQKLATVVITHDAGKSRNDSQQCQGGIGRIFCDFQNSRSQRSSESDSRDDRLLLREYVEEDAEAFFKLKIRLLALVVLAIPSVSLGRKLTRRARDEEHFFGHDFQVHH